ncbi:MAG: cupin domain-containing protein [Bacteroidales bacterium]|nr:cupin domain-containing protein [Bacteroidales bacterium]
MYHNPTSTENATKLSIVQDAWMLFRFENHEVIRLHLAPGESMENHINEWRIVFFVLRGGGSLDVEGTQYELREEQSIAVKAGKKRFWHNSGTKVLELLVMKTKERDERAV